MANDTFIPFGHRPSAIDYGNTGRSYTCPSGKYARARITLSAAVYGSITTTTGGVGSESDSDSNAVSFDVWLDDGETLAVSTIAANTSGSASTVGRHGGNDFSSATCQVNSQTISVVSAHVELSNYLGGTGTVEWNIDGRCEAYFHVEEYDIQT